MPSPPLVSYQVVPPETGLDSGGSSSSVYSTYGYAALSDSPTSALTIYGSDLDQECLQQTTFIYVPQQGETHTIYSYETPKEEDDEDGIVAQSSTSVYDGSTATVVTNVDSSTYAVLSAQPTTAYVQRANISSNRSRQYSVTSSGCISVSTATTQPIPVSSTQTQTFLIRPATNGVATSSQQPQGAVYNRSHVYKPVVTGTPQPPLVIPAYSAATVPTTATKSVSSISQGPSTTSAASARPSYASYAPTRSSPQKSTASERKSKSSKKEPIDQKGVDEEVARNVSQILNASMNHRLSSSSSTSSSRSYSSTSSSNGSSANQGKKPQQQHVCKDCKKTVSSTRNLQRHRQSCKAALQRTMPLVNMKPPSVPSATPSTALCEQTALVLHTMPQSAPATVEATAQPCFEEKPVIAENVNYVSVSVAVPVSAVATCSPRMGYVQSVPSTNAPTHAYVPLVIKEQPIVSSIQPQVYEVRRTSELQLENGQPTTIIYNQYTLADTSSFSLSDGPHCDDRVLDNAVASLPNNPITFIDSNDLSSLNTTSRVAVPVSQPPPQPPQPQLQTHPHPHTQPQPQPLLMTSEPQSLPSNGIRPTSMAPLVIHQSKSSEPAIHQCESCSKIVSSSRSLKRHRSTCKKYLEEYGHLLEDPQTKLNAIGTCSVRTSTTNVCEACSRQLCSASNLKRHRATCKALLNGEGFDSMVDQNLEMVTEDPPQLHSIKSEPIDCLDEKPPKTLSLSTCTSISDSALSLSPTISDNPWITVGEHLRAKHLQKQRELQQQQRMAEAQKKSPDESSNEESICEEIAKLSNNPIEPKLEEPHSGRVAPIAELLNKESNSSPPLSNVMAPLSLSAEPQPAPFNMNLEPMNGVANPMSPYKVPSPIQVSPLLSPSSKKKVKKEDLRFECPECAKTYSCRKNVKRHRMAVHKMTLEQLQHSESVRIVVVSNDDPVNMATYAHLLNQNSGVPNAIIKIQPSAITTVVPLSDELRSMTDDRPAVAATAKNSPTLPSSSASAVSVLADTVSNSSEVVSFAEGWKERTQHDVNIDDECTPMSTVQLHPVSGMSAEVDGCDYSKQILEKSKYAERAEADSTFIEEIDDLVGRPSTSPHKPQTSSVGCAPSPLDVSMSSTPASTTTSTPMNTSACTRSLPSSPMVCLVTPATTQSAINTPAISPFAPEKKQPKTCHICEACNKSLSSDYSLRRHKSTCVHYKAMMEKKNSAAVNDAHCGESTSAEQKENVACSSITMPSSVIPPSSPEDSTPTLSSVDESTSTAVAMKTGELEQSPEVATALEEESTENDGDDRDQSKESVASCESEMSSDEANKSSDSTPTEEPTLSPEDVKKEQIEEEEVEENMEEKNVEEQKIEEIKSEEVSMQFPESLICKEELIEDVKPERAIPIESVNDEQTQKEEADEWFVSKNELPPPCDHTDPPPSTDVESTTTSSIKAATPDADLPNIENGLTPLKNDRKRAASEDISDEDDKKQPEGDSMPPIKVLKKEAKDDAGDSACDSKLNGCKVVVGRHSLAAQIEPRPPINYKTDALLHVGRCSFEIPKQFLAVHSHHFDNLFRDHPNENSFILPNDIESGAFEKSLGVIANQIALNESNIDSILHVAERLKITYLRKQCRMFIKHTLSGLSLMHAIRLSDEYCFHTLKKRLINSVSEETLREFNEDEEYEMMSSRLKAELLDKWTIYL